MVQAPGCGRASSCAQPPTPSPTPRENRATRHLVMGFLRLREEVTLGANWFQQGAKKNEKNETWTRLASLANMRVVSALSPDAFRFAMEDKESADRAVERALVGRARTGDEKAFRLIFERHAPSVRRFLHDLLRDGESADEGTQEVFVRAHGRLGSLRDDDKLQPWLFG